MVIGIDASRAFIKDRTGTEEYSYQLITHILSLPEAIQHSFVLYTRPGAIIPDQIYHSKNVIIHEINYRYLWTQLGLALATWREFANPEREVSEITLRVRNKIDVLWIPAHTLPILRNPNLKTVVTIHGMEYKWLPEYRNWLQRWYLPLSTYFAAKYATKLIAVSENTKKDLIKEVQIVSNKIKVIYEGVVPDNQKTQSTRIFEKYGLVSGKYILFIGSIQPRKNLPALIEAFAIFSSKIPDYKLVISGGKGWMSEETYQAVVSSGLEDRVIFTGRVSEVEKQALLAQAKVYVQPSITEGFGLPVLEAMATSVPVITSNGGALPEVVKGAGVVVKLGAGFSKRLASELTKIVVDKSIAANLINSAYKRASELTWDKAAKETFQYLIYS